MWRTITGGKTNGKRGPTAQSTPLVPTSIAREQSLAQRTSNGTKSGQLETVANTVKQTEKSIIRQGKTKNREIFMSFYLHGVEDGDREQKPMGGGDKTAQATQLVPTGAARMKPLAERMSKGTSSGGVLDAVWETCQW